MINTDSRNHYFRTVTRVAVELFRAGHAHTVGEAVDAAFDTVPAPAGYQRHTTATSTFMGATLLERAAVTAIVAEEVTR